MLKRRNLPLDGVTVLDLGQIYQGPYAGFLLAQAGATVIKIEPPKGEPIRHRARVSNGAAIPFAMLNGNKKAISLDLKSPEGCHILKGLVAQADVLLENYAPGVMDRLGVGFEVLHAINPRLVYASASGYGLSGPDRNNLAMDITIQAASGMMSITGFPDGAPVKAGPAVADFIGAAHLYGGIVTALYERELTGLGRLVEVAMIEAVYPTLASGLSFVFDRESAPPRTGNRHGAMAEAPYNVYPAADGFVAIIAVNESHWVGLAQAMGKPELAVDPRFATAADRVRNMDLTDSVVGGWTAEFTKAEIVETLTRHKVPTAPVRDLMEVTRDTHMHARGMLEWVDHPHFGRVVLPSSPIRYHGTDSLARLPSARLGEHNAEVLTTYLGLAIEDIERLHQKGVLGQDD
ncbi:formyl-CoA transferase [Bradyrhizobium sp. NAS80.1]|uniref:CaiB/BaiF CoA transferase family protein n=1 Tax=Bradyrhizobium sp. NAS80.1 TaxID=1680159 RepID=UPI00095AEAD4|nr:CoA transferase [Bradyrhizobium sp. NAS80.1]OKO75506.1 formyl-CoA transferase [Bradyrhizobium sp. NAS80.1]